MIRAKMRKRPRGSVRDKKIAQILNDIADITTGQIKTDVLKGKDIHGVGFASLNPKTIESKRRRGSKTPSKPLMDTGLMRKVFRSKTASATSLESRVSVAGKRKEIAEYHNDGEGNLPKREWFGIGTKTKKRLNKMIKARTKGVVRFK